MARNHNTNGNGGAWSEAEKKEVWEKGDPIEGFSSDIWRHDICSKTMKWSEHGNRDSDYGWEIDHINPLSNDGDDDIDNLQPLHWKNNADKADKLNWTCP